MSDEQVREIQELNIIMRLPQICEYCGENIVLFGNGHENGDGAERLLFHSINGIHSDWRWGNKIPLHRKCHSAYHMNMTRDWSVAFSNHKRVRTDDVMILDSFARNGSPMTKSELLNNVGTMNAKRMNCALIVLKNMGRIREENYRRDGGGRGGTRYWLVSED